MMIGENQKSEPEKQSLNDSLNIKSDDISDVDDDKLILILASPSSS